VFGIAVGMAYLHSRDIMHRDLKGYNVFINDNWEPVVAGFELAKCCSGDSENTWSIGTPLFMAPEVFGVGRPKYDLSVDVYAFGMLLYMMFAMDATPKFEDGQALRNMLELMRQVLAGVRYERLPNISDYYWGIIGGCWSQSPSDRPSFPDLVEEFRTTHEYVLDGACMSEVARYEEFVTSGSPRSPGNLE
jgi:serine/threonine protein kinase